MTPSQIEKKIEKISEKYHLEMSNLADEVLHKKIIPYCDKHELSFFIINGIPSLVDKNNNYVSLPKFILNLYNICDENGNKFIYYMNDYNPLKHNLLSADEKHFANKYKNRELGSLMFSPAFAMLK